MPEVTVIVPAYNEEAIIADSMKKITSFLGKKYDFILMVANDGSVDRTANIVKEAAKRDKRIKLISLERNQGRGAALTEALRQCRTKYAIYFDADLQIDISLFHEIISGLRSGYDMAIGSKHHPDAKIEYPPLRRIASKGYTFLTRLILGCPIMDYQCGFKGFNVKKIQKILHLIKQKGWSWDTEIVVKSYWAGLSIKEMPADVKNVYARQSKVKLFRDIKRMGKGILQIRRDKSEFLEQLRLLQDNAPSQSNRS